LPREVTKMNSRIPAARASSIAYWISGRSTSGMISLGTDFVAGRNLVPKPATGKTAFVTLLRISPSLSEPDKPQVRFFVPLG
jgi:hypothetical protein